MSIIHFNKFFINKKYHMKKLFTLLIACLLLTQQILGQANLRSTDAKTGSRTPVDNSYLKLKVDPKVESENSEKLRLKTERSLSVLSGTQTMQNEPVQALLAMSGHAYFNDFGSGTVSGANTYVGLPTAAPGSLSDYVFDTEWSATTGATMALSGGALRISPLPSSGNATINLKIKVRCGYQLNITGVSFKHSRNNDGPQTVDLKIGSSTIATINPVPTGAPVAASFTAANLPQSTLGEINVFLDLKNINAFATGEYFLEDFELIGTYTYVGPSISFVPLIENKCEGQSYTSSPTITPGSFAFTSPTYSWYYGATNTSMAAISPAETGSTYTDASVALAEEGVYGIRINYNECVGNASNTAITGNQGLNVKPNPTLSGIAPSVSAVCNGGSVGFTASGLLDGSNTFNYTVTGPGGPFTGSQTVTVSGNTYTFSPSAYPVGMYSITINSITVDGCTTNTFTSGSNTATFTVNPLPSPAISSSGGPGFTENFDGLPSIPAGWAVNNLSSPTGTTGWFQGNNAVFNAFNGASNSYVGANFDNTGNTGTISNWLIMPNVNLNNGDVLTFYTRKVASIFPDRLQVRMSTSGASTNVGSLATDVGDFTTLLLDINQSLTSTGYPNLWTQYTVTISGLSNPVSGRLAFRYFVTNAGQSGANSDYIGIDAVNYVPVSSNFVCAGSTTPFIGTPGVVSPATVATATWTTSDATKATVSTSSGVVTGVAAGTAVISYTVTDNNGCSATATKMVTVNAVPAPSVSGGSAVCVGSTTTLMGTAGVVPPASLVSAIWSSSSTSNATVSSGGVVTGVAAGTAIISYTITDNNGCVGTGTKQITINALPTSTLSGNGSPSSLQVCSGSVFTVTAGTAYTTSTWTVTPGVGASTSNSSTATSSATFTVTNASSSATASVTVTYSFTDNNGCSGSTSVVVTVNPKPSAGASITNAVGISPGLCEGGVLQTVNLSATPSGGLGTFPLVNTWTSAPSGVLSLVPSNNTAVGTSGAIADPTPFSDATVTYSVTDIPSGCVSDPITTTVRVFNTPTTADAGSDQAKCNDGSFTLAGNTPSVGTGMWTIVGSPNGASITMGEENLPAAHVTGLTAGQSVTLRWTITNGPCTASTDDVVLKNDIQNTPTISVVLPSTQAQCNNGSFNLSGSSTASTGLAWTTTAGSVTSATSAITSITGVPYGTATVTFTVTNGACTASSSIVVTNNQPPSTATITNNPSVEACNAALFTVNAVATTFGTGTWSVSAGGTVVSSTSATTIITVPLPATNADNYTATWTVSAAGCPSSTASVNLINYHLPTTSAAGADQALCNTATFTLAGNVPTFGTGVWTVQSGPGSVTASTAATSTVTGVTIPSATANVSTTLRWTISNGVCPATTDDVVLRNDAPVTASITPVNNQCGNPVFAVTGNTPTFGTGVWTVTGGSITTGTTGSPSVSITAAAPDAPVTATWTVTNGACSSSSAVTFEYDATTTATITAVPDQCGNDVFAVTANNPSVGTGVWTVTGGSITTGTTGSPSVSITATAPDADVTATWTVTNGTCVATATEVFQYDAVPTADAGPATITVCNQSTAFNLSATSTPPSATGVWTVTAGAATIANTTSATTTATIAIGSSATLVWTVTNGTCMNSASDQIVIKNNNPITVSLAASPFPEMCVSGSAITLSPTISGGQGSGFYTTQAYSSAGLFTTLAQAFNVPTLTQVATITPGATAGTDVITFTVTDNAGCTASTSFSAVVNQVLTASVNPSTAVDVCVGSTGSLTANAGGGSGPGNLTYAWTVTAGTGSGSISGSSTGTSVSVMGTTAGTVTVSYTVTDIKTGCSTSASKVITVIGVTASAAVTSNYNGAQLSCNGASDGIIMVTPGGNGVGTLAYTISASPANTSGASTGIFTGLAAGTYTVTVTDVTGCTATSTATITAPAAVSASITSQTNVTCNGASTGAFTLSAMGGTGTKTITNISPSAGSISGLSVTGLLANTYTVTVRDANSCSATVTVMISQPPALTLSGLVTSNYNGAQISCSGSTNGAITLTGGGGTGTLTYSGPGMQSGNVFSGLGAGTHVFTVTDASSCTKTASVTITAPTAVSASIASQTAVSCFGGNNGSVTVNASGGTGTKTVTNVSGPSAGTISGLVVSNLTAGTYTFTVTDANGCTATTTATVSQPTQLLAGLSAVGTFNGFNIACNGGSTGQVQATALQGTAPYTYAFDAEQTPGGMTSIRTGLAAGTHTVTITDNNGCTATAVVVLTQPSAAVSLAVVGTPNSPSCAVGQGNSANGSASVNASGGVGSYSYNWGVGNTPASASNTGLSAGTYTVTVTDGNNCSTTVNVVITAPPTQANPTIAVIDASGVTNNDAIICAGESVTLTASLSGVSVFNWSPSISNGVSFMPGSSATYTVTAVSGLGCTSTASQNVVVNVLPTITLATVNTAPTPNVPAVCTYGGGFNIPFSTVTGGANQFSLSPTTASADASGAGYTVINFSDPQGAFSTTPINISSPNVPANVAATTGVQTYRFNLLVKSSTTGCVSASATPIRLEVNARPSANLEFAPVAFGSVPKEFKSNTTNASNLQIDFTGGNPSWTAQYSNAAGTQSVTTSSDPYLISNPNPGVYNMVDVTDVSSCAGLISGSATIKDGRFAITQNPSVPATICNGTSVTLTAAAGFTNPNSALHIGTLSYKWEEFNGTWQAIIGETNPANYTRAVTLADNGKMIRLTAINVITYVTNILNNTATVIEEVSSTPVTLNVNPLANTGSVTINPDNELPCAGNSKVFTAIPTGMGANPTYAWTLNGNPTGITMATYTANLSVGTNTVSVTVTADPGQCVSAVSASTSLTVNPSPVITSATAMAVCIGDAAFTLNLAYTGTANKFDIYPITPNQMPGFGTSTNNTLLASNALTLPANVPAGTYNFRVAIYDDATNCEDTEDFTLVVNDCSPRLDATVFLEGPLSGMLMSTGNSSVLPATQGGRTISPTMAPSVRSTIVDWIEVALYTSNAPGSNTVISGSRRFALLKNNGKIVDMDGVSPVLFSGVANGDYHVAVFHRFHLPTRTASQLAFAQSTTTPLTVSTNFLSGSLKSGAMVVGDLNQSGVITTSDYILVRNQVPASSIIYGVSFDVNMNGVLTTSDYILVRNNTPRNGVNLAQ
jgi:hypothetical protein